MYYVGEGTEQSDEKAAEWYRKGAEQGLDVAQFDLGTMCLMGRGTERSDVEALAWYLKAAEQGYADAQNNVCFMFEHGRGTEQSYEKAAEWYAKASEQRDTLATYHLGRLYEEGKGVPRAIDKAKELYADSAEWGIEDARKAILRLDPDWKEEDPDPERRPQTTVHHSRQLMSSCRAGRPSYHNSSLPSRCHPTSSSDFEESLKIAARGTCGDTPL